MRVEILVLKLQKYFGVSSVQMKAMGFFAKICTWTELKSFINALAKRHDISASKLRSIGFTEDDLQKLGMSTQAKRELSPALLELLAKINDNDDKENDNFDLQR